MPNIKVGYMDKKINSTKTTFTGTTLSCKLKEKTDMYKPCFIVQGLTKANFYNYAEFEGRYYWVDSISYDTADIQSVYCTLDALATFKNNKMRKMLIDLGIFSDVELDSRYDVLLDSYAKTIHVESVTAIKMVKSEIYPAAVKYLGSISDIVNSLINNHINNEFVLEDAIKLSELLQNTKRIVVLLEHEVATVELEENLLLKATYYRDKILPIMNELRSYVDMMEEVVSKDSWPIPTYTDLLFGI